MKPEWYLGNLKISTAMLLYSERVAFSLRKAPIIEIYHGSSVVNNVGTSSRIYFPMSE